VRYGANGLYFYKTATDGIVCSNSVFSDPAPNVAKQCAMTVRLSQTLLSTTTSSEYGPQATITCPSGAIDIWPVQDIQRIVDLYPGTTTFCLPCGSTQSGQLHHSKTGNTFVGEYGAILDGGSWTTTNSTQAAFRAHNQDIDDVTIRNLVIRNMPQKGIHAYYWMADHWTIESNEIAGNKTGIVFPNNSTLRNNFIHHNYGDPSSADASLRGGGYVGYYATNTTFDSNEISYNGKEQKVMESVGVTFRNNFVHHNQADGIWYDGGNPGALIEGNRVEDNARNGIFYEASNGSIIRNNRHSTKRRYWRVHLYIAKRADLRQHARQQLPRHHLLRRLRRGGRSDADDRFSEQRGARQLDPGGRPARRLCQWVQLHGELYGHTGRPVHRRVEEPDVLTQHVLRAVHQRVVLVLGSMDTVVAVAGGRSRRRRNRDAIARRRSRCHE
jgi:parallel beta-helix repeat protein